MKTDESKELDRLFLKAFLKTSPSKVTEEEIAYFRDHPDQIDEITAPVNVHKYFLWWGALIGVACVAISKLIEFSGLALLSGGFREFTIEIIFEIGVALIGAAVTAYLLGILLNQQQDNAAAWRSEIRRQIAELES